MKKFLRFPLYAAMAAMMTFNFSACSDDDDPDGGDTELSEKDKRYQAIADQFTKNTVIVTYTGLADQTEALVEKLKALKADKTDDNVKSVCETFLNARAWWEKSEAFLFGAASDFGIDPHIDSWPLDLDGLLDEMKNTSHITAMEAEDADVWAGVKLGPELLGFHGIEYIIFEAGSPKAVSKIKDKELTYAIAVAGDLRNKCYQLQISWAGADNVDANRVTKVVDELEWNTTVAGGENSYTQNMMLAGQVGSTYTSWTGAMQAIIDGLALLGVDAWEEGDDLFVEGNPQLQVPEGLVFESHGDHRLAMTWALVGACGRIPVSVTRFTCVAVSYPDFLADLKGLVK